MKKKLIEVALPLEAINQEAAREKSIRHGHPSTIHLWWARRPLAACRAVLFASLVDDPSAHPERFPTEEAQDRERDRLFRLIESLVKWDNVANDTVIEAARREIAASCGSSMPVVMDPFAGGGSIPLEAQRLGLGAFASDLNPIAVMINRALIDIPTRFARGSAVHPRAPSSLDGHRRRDAHGLAADVLYYGRWMRDRARERLSAIYPHVTLPGTHGAGRAPVVAWLWTRVATCPNPACGARMPLASTFVVVSKKGQERWVVPAVDRESRVVRFRIGGPDGHPPAPPKLGRGARFRCLVCEEVADETYIVEEGRAKRIGTQMMAVVADDGRRRIYLPPDDIHETAAREVEPPAWMPEGEMSTNARWFSPSVYGFARWADIFTDRQLLSLTTLADLVNEARVEVLRDAVAAGWEDDGVPLRNGGGGATAYAEAVSVYLGFCVDKATLTNCTLATWQATHGRLTQALGRQALPMAWDFAEANPLSDAGGGFALTAQAIREVLERVPAGPEPGRAEQLDATAGPDRPGHSVIIATDPPYYDNIGYADLSDYFYGWLRHSIKDVFPDEFSTLEVPKGQELVATPHRFKGGKQEAERFFEEGLEAAFRSMRSLQDRQFPLTVFYAFKQAEGKAGEAGGTASTGWETMLEGLIGAGFAVHGTWPVRTELTTSLKKTIGALASSVVLVCRERPEDAPLATRKDFVTGLRNELPTSLRHLQGGNIAPVDLAQAAIGPGMAVFSKFSRVIEADGSRMTVRSALALINHALDELLAEQEGDFDPDTRWAVAWFEQYGLNPGAFGVAETLSKAKNTATNALVESGILEAKAGRVRLLDRHELSPAWDPASDSRLTVWEVCQYLIRVLQDEGELAAAKLVRTAGGMSALARELAYRLFAICERKGWAQEAFAYNSLVVAWPELQRLASSGEALTIPSQLELS